MMARLGQEDKGKRVKGMKGVKAKWLVLLLLAAMCAPVLAGDDHERKHTRHDDDLAGPEPGMVAGFPELADDATLAPSRAGIVQQGTSNYASAVQRGAGHVLPIRQEGNQNSAIVVQTGAGQAARIEQVGDANLAQLNQDGYGNRSGISQRGQGNTADVEQIGLHNSAVVVQTGSGLVVGVQQIGNFNRAFVEQSN